MNETKGSGDERNDHLEFRQPGLVDRSSDNGRSTTSSDGPAPPIDQSNNALATAMRGDGLQDAVIPAVGRKE